MKKGLFYRLIVSRLVPFLARHPGALLLLGVFYLISPIDLFPEAFTGPLGYLDDIVVLVTSYIIGQKFRARRPGPAHVASHAPSSPKLPHDILGISRRASQEEIKKAYRKKMAEYHPDKVAHLGEELQDKAAEKTREIQQAYEALTK